MSKATRSERQRRRELRRLMKRVAELEQHVANETKRADDLEVLIREGRFKVGVRIAKLTRETRKIPKPCVEARDGAIRLRLEDGEAAGTINDLVKCFKAFSKRRKLRTDPARAAAVDEWIYDVATRIHAEQDPNIFNDVKYYSFSCMINRCISSKYLPRMHMLSFCMQIP